MSWRRLIAVAIGCLAWSLALHFDEVAPVVTHTANALIP